MDPIVIKQRIESCLSGVTAEVEGDDGVHFKATVTGSIFEGKSRVVQQQMVYGAIDDWIKSGQLHAISIQTIVSE